MSGMRVQGEIFRPFEVFIMVALLYWGLNETIAILMRKFEKWSKKGRISNQDSAETLRKEGAER